MANSKNTVTTIPLTSKLNMNRNQNQVCSTFDQMNKQNSPVFGGCISPLHSKFQTKNSEKGIIDKYGKKWYYSGTHLYQCDENGGNAQEWQNFNGSYVFKDIVLDFSPDAGCFTGSYAIFAKIIDDTNVKLYRYSNSGTYITEATHNFDVSGISTIRNVRLVERDGYFFIIVVAIKWQVDTNPVCVFVRGIDPASLTETQRAEFYTQLGTMDYTGRKNFYPLDSIADSSKQDKTTYTYPIIVSKGQGNWFGITVLNRHMNGENVLDDFGYVNFVYQHNMVNLQPVHVSGGPIQQNSWCTNNGQKKATLKGGKVLKIDDLTVSAQAPSVTLNGSNSDQGYRVTGPAGIFQENNDWLVQLHYGNYTNRDGFCKSSDNDYENIYPMSFKIPRDNNGNGEAFWASLDSNQNPSPNNSDAGYNVNDYYVLPWSCIYATKLYTTGPNDLHECAAFTIDYDTTTEEANNMLQTINCTTVTTNQYHVRVIHSGSTPNWGYKSSVVVGGSVMLDSMLYGQSRYMPGITSTVTIPTKKSDWQSIGDKRFVDKTAMYNTTGSCTQLGLWRVLFNYREGFLSGISWNNGVQESEGTLVTPWDEVDDGFVVDAYNTKLMYKDISGKIHIITASPATEELLLDRTSIVDNRYLLIECDSPQNVLDLVENKWGKFASDWNNRVLQGFNGTFHKDSVAYRRWINNQFNMGFVQGAYNSTSTNASGFNVAYQSTKSFSPSRLLPFTSSSLQVCLTPYFVGVKRASKVEKGSVDKLQLDYFQSTGTSSPMWKGAIGNNGMTGDSTSLQGTAYPITSKGSLYNNMPIVGTKFINSYNGRFATQINGKGYSNIYDGVRPTMLYNSTSIVDNIKEFFIIQSQTYAVVDSYLCAISYSSSNVINGIEPLVDVNGMQFIGSFPSVAYFYSPAARSIYAFTGDADLQLFVQTDRINTVYNHLYAPNNEWIFITTNDGLYVFTQQNVFRVSYSELLQDVDTNYLGDIQLFMTDDSWDVIGYRNTSGTWNYLKVRLDKGDSTWKTNNVEVETEFFGKGDMKQEVCDTWYIRLFKGDEDDNGEVEYSVKTLTDVVKETDHKSITITPDMWDSNDNVFIRYQPQYQMTQGSSLHIKSPYPIAYMGVSHQLDNTSVSHLNI